MKKVLYFTCFLLFTITSYSQTTITEYNYITKGLVEDIRTGRDIKSGYSLVDIYTNNKVSSSDGSWWNVKLYHFREKTSNKNKAFVIECTDSGNNLRFLCIPTSDASSQLWDSAYREIRETSTEWHMAIMWAFAKLSSRKAM